MRLRLDAGAADPSSCVQLKFHNWRDPRCKYSEFTGRLQALRVHRVRGDDCALNVQHLEQRRSRPDLIGLLVDRHLPEHDPGLRGEGPRQMQRREIRRLREGAPEHFAVDRDLPDALRLQRLCSPPQTGPDPASGAAARTRRGWAGRAPNALNRRRNSSLFFAKSSISTQVCPSHRFESIATVSIS